MDNEVSKKSGVDDAQRFRSYRKVHGNKKRLHSRQ